MWCSLTYMYGYIKQSSQSWVNEFQQTTGEKPFRCTRDAFFSNLSVGSVLLVYVPMHWKRKHLLFSKSQNVSQLLNVCKIGTDLHYLWMDKILCLQMKSETSISHCGALGYIYIYIYIYIYMPELPIQWMTRTYTDHAGTTIKEGSSIHCKSKV